MLCELMNLYIVCMGYVMKFVLKSNTKKDI
ncbi:hypothetical protein M2135_002703 [Parabacteroides sp. PF5-9]|nr:hypothetical protein [Parabacteroides sp. PF5-9]